MATRAEIIDAYFRSKDYFPHVAYRPLGKIMVEEVGRMGPGGLFLSTAAALVEKESGGKQVFGCDWGGRWTHEPPFCQVEVTEDRVKALIRNVDAGGGQNGVGTTQLTSIGYVKEAERMGGAHLARFQMRVGFRVLNDHIAALGWPAGAAAYNAGPGNWRSVVHTYGASMQRLEREWAARLAAASDGKKGEPAVPRKKLAPPGFVRLDPKPGSANYQDRHPTRYGLRPDVRALAFRLYERFGRDRIHINTYVEHPEGIFPVRDRDSFDVWGPDGRGDPIDPEIGTRIVRYVFDDPNPPWIDWVIWQERIWGYVRGTWIPFGDGSVFEAHRDHPHFTFRP